MGLNNSGLAFFMSIVAHGLIFLLIAKIGEHPDSRPAKNTWALSVAIATRKLASETRGPTKKAAMPRRSSWRAKRGHPEEKPQQSGFFHVVEGDDSQDFKPLRREARLLNGDQVHIPYPPKAIQYRIEGSVHLRLKIAKSGEVHAAQVMSGPGYGLTKAALALVEEFRFSPATNDEGEAVASEVMHEVIYKLK